MTPRDGIRDGICLSGKTTLEIGPLANPIVKKAEGDVIYVDHADTATIRAKYKDAPGVDVGGIVDVDAIWGEQTLQECIGARKVDYVFASHVIEHVPDLVTWLQELSSVLREDGQIRLIIPDKRFSFDFLRRTTGLPEVLDAYLRRARRPQLLQILDHLLWCTTLDPVEAWEKTVDPRSLKPLHTYESALLIAKDAFLTHDYHDVHCWVFTPTTFAELMWELAQAGVMKLACLRLESTAKNTLEFSAHLQNCTNHDTLVASWRRAQESARAGDLTNGL